MHRCDSDNGICEVEFQQDQQDLNFKVKRFELYYFRCLQLGRWKSVPKAFYITASYVALHSFEL